MNENKIMFDKKVDDLSTELKTEFKKLDEKCSLIESRFNEILT